MGKKTQTHRDDCPTCRGMGWLPVPYAFRVKCLKCGNNFQPTQVDVQISMAEKENNKPKTNHTN